MRTRALPGYTPDVRKRFAAALAVSVLVHALAGVGGGAGSRKLRPHVPVTGVPLRVELHVRAEEPPRFEPPQGTEMPQPARPVRRFPTRSQPAKGSPSPTARSPADAGIAAVSDATYYPARQLDVFPTLASPLDVGHQAAAVGRVLLLVMIDAEGAVNDSSIVEAEPAGVFEDDARRALSRAKFRPALRHGRAVASRVLIEINYGSDATAAR